MRSPGLVPCEHKLAPIVQYITYANTSLRIQSPRYSHFLPRIVYPMMLSFNRYTALDNIYRREFTFGNKYELYEYLTSHK